MKTAIIKALVVVTSHAQLGQTGKDTGWYLSEVSHAYYPMSEAGLQIDFASPNGGAAPMDAKSLDLKDPINNRFVQDTQVFSQLKNTIAMKDVNPNEYQVIYFAGGHGTMWDFADNQDIKKVTTQIYEKGGVVAAVCHGPAALVGLKLSNGKYLVDGKAIAAFSNDEEEAVELTQIVPFSLETKLRLQGGQYTKAPPWKAHVVVDQRLITGQNPASAEGVGRAIVRELKFEAF